MFYKQALLSKLLVPCVLLISRTVDCINPESYRLGKKKKGTKERRRKSHMAQAFNHISYKAQARLLL